MQWHQTYRKYTFCDLHGSETRIKSMGQNPLIIKTIRISYHFWPNFIKISWQKKKHISKLVNGKLNPYMESFFVSRNQCKKRKVLVFQNASHFRNLCFRCRYEHRPGTRNEVNHSTLKFLTLFGNGLSVDGCICIF